MRRKTKRYFDDEGNLIIKPYRMKELAVIFDMNVQTLKRRLDEYPEMQRSGTHYYTINQLEFLISKIGLPRKVILHMDRDEKITVKQAA